MSSRRARWLAPQMDPILGLRSCPRHKRAENRRRSSGILPQFSLNRRINPRTNFNVADIQADLPRTWRWDDNIAADELVPVHVVAKRRSNLENFLTVNLAKLWANLEGKVSRDFRR